MLSKVYEYMWAWRIGGKIPTGNKQIIPRKIGLSAMFFYHKSHTDQTEIDTVSPRCEVAKNLQRMKMFDNSALRNVSGHEK
jgi:hypothetical protein